MPRTVAIVDDSKFLVRTLCDYFRNKIGFEVVASGKDGVEAIDIYQRFKPDLLTIDITMPNKDGMAATAEILKHFPDARIMVISAVRGSAMLDCMNMGAKGYVEKPLKLDDPVFEADFRETIEEIFHNPEPVE